MSAHEKVELRKELGVFDLTVMGVGGIVGSGIFVLSGEVAAKYAGPAIILSFALTGACCLVYALCFAEMAAMLPSAGSAYSYTRTAFGQFAGFMVGWALVAEYLFCVSAVAVGWSGYVASTFRLLGYPLPDSINDAPLDFDENHGIIATGGVINLPAVTLVAFCTLVVSLGVKNSSTATAIAVVVKLSIVAVFVSAGVFFINPELWQPFIVPSTDGEFGHFGWTGVVRASSVIFFAYIGFDAITTAAAETKNPQVDLPLGIFYSLGISTALYMAVATVMTGLVSYTELGVPDPIVVALEATGPKLSWLVPWITVAVVVGIPGVVMVSLYAITRILYIMACDGMLPELFKELNSTFATPLWATVIAGVTGGLIAGLFPIGVLAELVSVGTLLAFGFVCAGIIQLRNSQPELDRPYQVPFSPYVPGLGVFLAIAQVLFLPWTSWVRMAVWMGGGLILWFTIGSKAEPVYDRIKD